MKITKDLHVVKMMVVMFALLLLVVFQVQAKPLTFYRSEFSNFLPQGGVEGVESNVKNRISSLRTQLKTNTLNWPEVEGDTFRSDSAPQTGRKTTSSGILKPYLDDAVEVLIQKKTLGKPPVYNPGRVPNSRDRKRQKARQAVAILDAVVENSKPVLIGGKTEKFTLSRLVEIYEGYVKYKNHLKKTQKKEDRTSQADARRLQIVSNYLTQNQPKETATIESILGPISKVEVVDRMISKVYFKGDLDIGFSLSMLITFKTGKDHYFVDLLEGLYRVVSYVAMEDKDEDEEIEALWRKGSDEEPPVPSQQVVKVMKDRLNGARYINRKLRALSDNQVNFLLDLFLQGMGTQIWSKAEVYPEGEGKKKSENQAQEKPQTPYVKILDASFNEGFINSTNGLTKEIVQEDMSFYTLISNQITDLEEYLELSDGMRSGYEKDIERLRKKK